MNDDKKYTIKVRILNGNNFIKKMINAEKAHDEVREINDQIGTPTYTFNLARLPVDMCVTGKYGYYHATNVEVRDENGKVIKEPISITIDGKLIVTHEFTWLPSEECTFTVKFEGDNKTNLWNIA